MTERIPGNILFRVSQGGALSGALPDAWMDLMETAMNGRLMFVILMVSSGLALGCSDRLAQMQEQLAGTWELESRLLPDGTVLRKPEVSGVFSWQPIDSRKAHVTLNILVDAGGEKPRTFNFAASKYEISTSAITRSRYLLFRQGYRSSSEAPITIYHKAKVEKGKITLEDGLIRITHERGYSEEFRGDQMVGSFPDVFVDTWKRVR